MKKISRLNMLFILLTIILGLVGCQNSNTEAGSETYTNLTINIPWIDSEQMSYRVDNASGKTIGKVVLSIEKEEDVYILGQNHIADDAQIDGFVAVDQKTMAPVVSYKVMSSATAGTTELSCSYDNNRVTVVMPVDAGVEDEESQVQGGSMVIALPDVVFDNDEILFLGRTLPLREGYSTEIASFVVAQLSTPVVLFSVTGREMVQTPVGEFDCYKVRVGGISEESIQSTAWLWYSIQGTHPLVKYSSDSGSFVLIG